MVFPNQICFAWQAAKQSAEKPEVCSKESIYLAEQPIKEIGEQVSDYPCPPTHTHTSQRHGALGICGIKNRAYIAIQSEIANIS